MLLREFSLSFNVQHIWWQVIKITNTQFCPVLHLSCQRTVVVFMCVFVVSNGTKTTSEDNICFQSEGEIKYMKETAYQQISVFFKLYCFLRLIRLLVVISEEGFVSKIPVENTFISDYWFSSVQLLEEEYIPKLLLSSNLVVFHNETKVELESLDYKEYNCKQPLIPLLRWD